MTHSSHRFTMLSADDVALCRAHSRAVASEPDHIVWARECGAPTTQQRAAWSREEAYRAACDDFERVTLNQAQSDAYWQWQRDVHAPVTIGFDLGTPEGDATVIALAPAKTAAEQPESAVGVWNSEDPTIPGVYVACHAFQDHRPKHYAHWSGMNWTITYNEPSSAMEGRRRGNISSARDYLWLRLIEADAPSNLTARLAATSIAADGAALIGANPSVPAQQPAQKASTHSVCIRAYGPWKVGEVACWDGVPQAIPANWLPCDESGWVTHVPTADSVCPVPEGLDFDAMWNNGDVSGLVSWYFREHVNTWRSNHINAGLRAWRPIAQS